MINPAWLDHAYIVENEAVNYDKSIDISSATRAGNDISATKYQEFVNKNPGKTTYYQPVLDRLEVRPSVLDLKSGSILVEGKSDYYIIRYAAFLLGRDNVLVVPAFGSTTYNLLIPILRSMSHRFRILLDSDDAGKVAARRYAEFDLDDGVIVDLQSACGSAEPEHVLSVEDRELIKTEMRLTGKLSKKNIMRFFRQALAEEKGYPFSTDFKDSMGKIIDALTT
jgi:hypothetical protein